jgi:hypothetical protein
MCARRPSNGKTSRGGIQDGDTLGFGRDAITRNGRSPMESAEESAPEPPALCHLLFPDWGVSGGNV